MVSIGQMIVPQNGTDTFRKARIVRLDAWNEERRAWIVDLEGTGLPRSVPLASIDEAVAEGDITLDQWLPASAILPPDAHSQRARRLQQAAWEHIKPLVNTSEKLNELFGPDRGLTLRCHAKEIDYPLPSLYRELHRWFAYGMTPAALYPNFRSVARGSRQAGGAKRGAPNRFGQRAGRAYTGGDRERIEAYIDDHIKKGCSVERLYQNLQADRFSTVKLVSGSGEEVRTLLPADQRPTEAQFRRIYRQMDAGLDLTRRRIGSRVWKNKFAAALTQTHTDLKGPGSRYEIDSTGTQVELVDKSGIPIGPASIYLVVDTWSNLITGYHLGVGAPSWDGAKAALYHAFTADKRGFCAYYGVTIDATDWPGGIAPCISDWGGEFLSNASDAAIKALGFTFTQGQRGLCRDRADGERTNGTIKTNLLADLVGYRPKFNEGRGSKDPRRAAGYTLYELNSEIIRWILRFNKTHAVTFEAMPIEARQARITPSRLSLWNWGIENLIGEIRTATADQLYIGLLPIDDKAKWEIKGLNCRKFHYTARCLEDMNAFSRVRLPGNVAKPVVRYDRSLPDRCYLWDPVGQRHVECERIDPSGGLRKYTTYDIEAEKRQYDDSVVPLDEKKLEERAKDRPRYVTAQRMARKRADERYQSTGRKTARGKESTAARKETDVETRLETALNAQTGYAPAVAPPRRRKKTATASLPDQIRADDSQHIASLIQQEKPS